jgi:hypothetical protein
VLAFVRTNGVEEEIARREQIAAAARAALDIPEGDRHAPPSSRP